MKRLALLFASSVVALSLSACNTSADPTNKPEGNDDIPTADEGEVRDGGVKPRGSEPPQGG